MMPCDSNGGSDIYLGVESLIPLVVGEAMLMKTVECHFLLIHGGEWVLIFCIGQYGLLNDGQELEWIIARACSVPITIMFHIVHTYMCEMTSHHL